MPKSIFLKFDTCVMFIAMPSTGMLAGYMPSSLAPFQYICSRGPGTFEIVTD